MQLSQFNRIRLADRDTLIHRIFNWGCNTLDRSENNPVGQMHIALDRCNLIEEWIMPAVTKEKWKERCNPALATWDMKVWREAAMLKGGTTNMYWCTKKKIEAEMYISPSFNPWPEGMPICRSRWGNAA